MHLKSIIYELLWFLKGDTNNKYLKDHGVTYGMNGQMRMVNLVLFMVTNGEDGQLQMVNILIKSSNVIDQIKRTPHSDASVVSAWNVADIEKMSLPPCHTFFSVYVVNKFYLVRCISEVLICF
jgi:thymidylate synthase